VNKPQKMLADEGYDSNEVRWALFMTGIVPVIPPKANRKSPPDCDFNACKDRNPSCDSELPVTQQCCICAVISGVHVCARTAVCVKGREMIEAVPAALAAEDQSAAVPAGSRVCTSP
jgi:hypothetical protein